MIRFIGFLVAVVGLLIAVSDVQTIVEGFPEETVLLHIYGLNLVMGVAWPLELAILLWVAPLIIGLAAMLRPRRRVITTLGRL